MKVYSFILSLILLASIAYPANCINNINTAGIIDAIGDTLTADTCVTVVEPCLPNADVIIYDSTYASQYNSTYNNQSIYIEGVFFVDINPFTLNSCMVYTAPGAQIIIQTNASLILSQTTIEGCEKMWQGIYMDQKAGIAVIDSSVIRDANMAIEARERCALKVENSYIFDCVRGIYVPANAGGGFYNIFESITGNRFGMNAAAFKPDYASQPAHGSRPASCIELNDVIMQIGGTTVSSTNHFQNSNLGIACNRSVLRIRNNTFEEIHPDTAYNYVYNGTAITGIGDTANHTASKIYVYQLAGGGNSVWNSRRGIYTDYSFLDAMDVIFTDVVTGVYSMQCKDGLSTYLGNMTIEATYKGIDWYDNLGSAGMKAEGNRITVDGDYAVGIDMQEITTAASSNYNITGNYITAIKGNIGISGANLYRPSISYNSVKIEDAFTGISLRGCERSLVSCNTASGNNASDTTKTGIEIAISTNSNIICNTVDSTGRGFFFGGISPSAFRGNTMKDHYVDLNLNNVAVLDTQTHGGNRWVGFYSNPDTIGAVNWNADSSQALLASLFIVNPSSNPDLLPRIPDGTNPAWPDDQGWFAILTTGSAFACTGVNSCNAAFIGGGAEELKMRIANEETLTSDFIPESKSMAKQYLYDKLMNDSALLGSNQAFEDFKSGKEHEATGLLYEATNALKKSTESDIELMETIQESYTLLKEKSDSLFYLDSLWFVTQFSGYEFIRAGMIERINAENAILKSFLNIHADSAETRITYAESKNNLVQPTVLPEENEKIVNDISIKFLRGGKDSILNYKNSILSISNQCPYLGGKAVYRARVFASLFNDTFIYDDVFVCSQQGLYRSSNLQAEKQIIPGISIKPNPTNEFTEIMLKGIDEGICTVRVFDGLGKMVLNTCFNCKEKISRFNTKDMPMGVYSVMVNVDNKLVFNEKLVIVR